MIENPRSVWSVVRAGRSSAQLRRYGFAALAVAIAAAVSMVAGGALDRSVFAFFFAAVALTAWYGGTGPAVAATVGSAVAAQYFLVEPRNSLALDDGDALRLAIFAMVSMLIGAMRASLDAARRDAEQRAREAAEARRGVEVHLRQLSDQALELERQTEEARRLALDLESSAQELLAARDTAERHRAQVERVLDSIGDGFLALGADWRVARLNAAAERILGLPAARLLGRVWWEALPSVRGTGVEASCRRALEEMRAVQTEERLSLPGGRDLWLEVHAYPCDGTLSVFIRDVSARKAAEVDRERSLQRESRARADAEDANRAKSQFLATMSHEIRTPVNAIVGYVDLLDAGVGGPLTGTQREFLTRMGASGRHLVALVDDILDLARIEAESVPLSPVAGSAEVAAAEAVALLAPQAATRGIALADERGGVVGSYWGDPNRVRQILVNLLTNAVKFTQPGGRIVIRTRIVEGSSPAGLAERPWLVFEVEDTGIGIAPERADQIFEPFVQVDGTYTRSQGGAGLGLAISRKLARLMGGEVTYRPAESGGSVFSLWMPLGIAAAEHPTADDGADIVTGWAFGPHQIPELAEVGNALIGEAGAVAALVAERIAHDPAIPGGRRMSRVHRENHLASTVTEIGKAMVALDAGGADRALVMDIAEIQRTIAERHGRQRLRHGWTVDEIRREHAILREELEVVIRRALGGPAAAHAEQALQVVHRLVVRAERVAIASHAGSVLVPHAPATYR